MSIINKRPQVFSMIIINLTINYLIVTYKGPLDATLTKWFLLYFKPIWFTRHLSKMAAKIVNPTNADTQMPFELMLSNSTASPTITLSVVITIAGLEEKKEYDSPINVLWESGLSQSTNNREYRLALQQPNNTSTVIKKIAPPLLESGLPNKNII